MCGKISSYVGYKTHPIAGIVKSSEFQSKRVELVHRWRVIAHNTLFSRYLEEGTINPEDQDGLMHRVYELIARVQKYCPVFSFYRGVPDERDDWE